MLRPRIIPSLLLDKGNLVKTVKFTNPKYLGDPLNTVKIFNEKRVDELIILDIGASRSRLRPDFKLISKLAKASQIPLCYGGGVRSIEDAEKIIDLGIEKVAMNSILLKNDNLITDISKSLGSQSTVAVIDIIKIQDEVNNFKYRVYSHISHDTYQINPIDLATKYQNQGIGEIIFNFVDKDGTMSGYDLFFFNKLRSSLSIPLTILGGAGSHKDIVDLFEKFGIIGASAGSLFVFKGKFKAVLVNYPDYKKKMNLSVSGLNKYNKNENV